MRTSWKRLIASVLLICFCFSLLPVTPAAAAEDLADSTGLSGHSGLVFDYDVVEVGTSKTPTIRVTISTYGVNNYYSQLSIRFQYNAEKLSLAAYNTGKPVTVTSTSVRYAKVPQSLVDLGIEDNVDIAGAAERPFLQGSKVINEDETESTYKEGQLVLDLNTGENIKSGGDIEGILDVNDNGELKLPANEAIKLFYIYLTPKEGYNMGSIEQADLGLYMPPGYEKGYLYGVMNEAGNGVDEVAGIKAPVFRNWPEAAPEYGSVKVTTGYDASNNLGGVNVTLAPKAKADGDPLTGTTIAETTSPDFGTYTFTNVPTGEYTLTIARDATGKDADGKTYQLGAASVNDVTVEKDKTSEVKVQSGFTEVRAEYNFTIKTANASGEAIALANANLNSTNVSVKSAADGALSVTTAVTGDNEITLQGLDGYQSKTVTLNIQGSNNVISEITSTDASVKVEGTVVTVTVPKTTTNVTVPLPIPTDPDSNEPVDGEQAKKMEITFTPKTDDAKAELGENIKVPVNVETDSEGKPTSITVNGDLPDGAYTMTIGGEGFASKDIDVTVVTVIKDGKPVHVVNVGGEPTIKNGEVESVTGGVTGSQTGNDSTANGEVDLSGKGTDTTILEGGNIDVSDPENPSIPSSSDEGVKDVNGGLLDSDAAKDPDGMGGQLTPSMDTDPTYEVVLKLDDEAPNSATKIIAEVYLKNLAAQSGSFGMYYDSKFFKTVEQSNIVFNPAITGLGYGTAYDTNPDLASNYVAFNWEIASSGTTLSGNPLLATIDLPLNDAYNRNNAKLLADMDNRSIYTEDYAQTATGMQIIADAAGDQDAIDEILGAAWRYTRNTNKYAEDEHGNVTGVAWYEGHAEFLEDAKATRDGFYQAYDINGIAYDVRMVFKPEFEINKLRADFWVTEPEDDSGTPGADIDKATIYITDDEEVMKAITLEDWASMNKATAEAKGMTVIETKNGYANTAQEAGTYFFVVMEDGHWTYPDGKAGNDQNPLYASYTLSETGVASAGTHTTNVINGYLNPQMASKTFHEVALEPETTSDGENATINSAAIAYNTVDYYFTLAPKAGYQFKKTMQELIDDGELTAKLYNVNASGADEKATFRDGEGQALTITWDSVREMFKIEGKVILGEGIGTNTNGYDALRAGDLVLTLDTGTDVLEQAQYKITATAGTGGKVSYQAADTNPGTVVDNTTASANAGDPYQGLVETLAQGSTTSATYTFTPDTGNKIGKVIINGVEQVLTEAQKTSTYTYQFINVSSDQTIYATFVDATTGEEKSDPYITVELGSHGKADITAETGTDGSMTPVGTNPFDPATVTGPDTQTYNVPMETLNDGEKENMKIVVTPDDGFEIDTILVGDTVLPKPADYDPTVGWTTETVEVEMKDGLTESVVITFKEIGGPSIQAIVIAKVKEGFGDLNPIGKKVYAVGERPTYTMTPKTHWTMDVTKDSGSVLLDGVDKSTDVEWTDKGTQDYVKGTAVTYQLPALAGGTTTLEVTFFEEAIKVHGVIRISAKVTPGDKVAPAHLKFYRAADPDKQTDAKTIEFDSDDIAALYTADSNYTQLSFGYEIPAGEWQVTVTKQGYLTRIIKEFTIDDAATYDIYFGDASSDGKTETTSPNMKAIPLLCGDAAGGGTAVALDDAAMVSAGWLASNKNLAKRIKADLNENTYSLYLGDNTLADNVKSDVNDMIMVKNNINQKRTTTDYTTFTTNP